MPQAPSSTAVVTYQGRRQISSKPQLNSVLLLDSIVEAPSEYRRDLPLVSCLNNENNIKRNNETALIGDLEWTRWALF